MAMKWRRLGVNQDVPQSWDEAARMQREIDEAARQLAAIETDLGDCIASLQAAAAEAAAPLREILATHRDALKIWHDANDNEVASGELSRTADMGASRMLSQPSSRKSGMRQTIRAFGQQALLRLREQVSKEAMLADPERVRLS